MTTHDRLGSGALALALLACTTDPTLREIGGEAVAPGVLDAGGSVDAGDASGACSPPADPSGPLPCDVAAILSQRCQRCHDTEDALVDCKTANACIQGPFPLRSLADVHGSYVDRPIYERMAEAVESQFMPLTAVSLEPPVQTLTEAERALLLTWLRACAQPDPGETDCR